MHATQAHHVPKQMGMPTLFILWVSPVLQAFMSNATQPLFVAPEWAYLPLYVIYTLGGWIAIATGLISYWHSLEMKTSLGIMTAQSAGASIAITLTATGNTTFNDFLHILLPLALLHVGMVMPFAMFCIYNTNQDH